MKILLVVVSLLLAILATTYVKNQSQQSIKPPLQPRLAPSVEIKRNSDFFAKCDPYWEIQNQTIEKAKSTKIQEEEFFLYFKSLAIGNAYQNCLTRIQNGK